MVKKFTIAIVILLTLIFAYRQFSAMRQPKGEKAQVVRGDLEEKLTISGKLEADERMVLRFQTSGRLVWVGVKEGDYVKKFQGIASLDQREVKKKLDRYLNLYLKSRWDFEQVKEDNKDKVVTDTIKRIIDKAQFDLNNSVIDVEIQHLAVDFANLWTPVEGLVVRADSPYAGVNIAPTQAEFEIINPKTVYFLALADQTEVVKLSEELEGELHLDSFAEEKISGKITKISFVPREGETGTVYTIKFTSPNENSSYRYRVGMTGDLTFVTQKKTNVLYLPLKFIKTEVERKYVVVGKNRKKTAVTVGMEADNLVEVVSGLSEGDIVYD